MTKQHDCRHTKSDGPRYSINVLQAWKQYNAYGRNVVLLIVDDGLETRHVDLRDNYVRTLMHTNYIKPNNFYTLREWFEFHLYRLLSITILQNPEFGYDAVDEDNDPNPIHSWGRTFSHGTKCGGVAAMKVNNTVCGIGLAPKVTLGGIYGDR